MKKVEQLLSLVRRGVLRRDDMVGDLVYLANELSAAEVVRSIPADVLVDLKRTIAAAPKSEDEWDQALFIVGGTYMCDAAEAAKASKTSYRNGVEQLRAYFDSTPQNA